MEWHQCLIVNKKMMKLPNVTCYSLFFASINIFSIFDEKPVSAIFDISVLLHQISLTLSIKYLLFLVQFYLSTFFDLFCKTIGKISKANKYLGEITKNEKKKKKPHALPNEKKQKQHGIHWFSFIQ